jgi:hypothetical protein
MTPGPTQHKSQNQQRLLFFLIIIAVIAMVWTGVISYIVGAIVARVGSLAIWGLSAAIMFLVLILAGQNINGQWAGVLIDSRNKYSLSRLQITLWTIMVLSAFFTMALPRIAAMTGPTPTLDQEQALDIRFPEQLILAMGISAASFAGANIINSSKKGRQLKIDARTTPEAARIRRDTAKRDFDNADAEVTRKVNAETAQKAIADASAADAAANPNDQAKKLTALNDATILRKLGTDKETAVRDRELKRQALQSAEEDLTTITEAQGLLHINPDPSDASWSDLFRGEEISNYKLVDMSKVQMLFFTLVVIITYIALLSNVLSNVALLRTSESLSFPAFSDSLNALLGISHGTYLTVKSVDHT